MKQIQLLTIQSKALNLNDLLSTIELATIKNHYANTTIIGSINLHALYVARNDFKFRKFYDLADFCYIDGMPIIWMLKALAQKISSEYRITVLDWHDKVLEFANTQSLTIGLLGGGKGVAELANKSLLRKYKNIHFICHHGFIPIDQTPSNIKDRKIDILLVGMGMPKEEIWVMQNKHKLNAKVIIPVGGYFDYIAGKTYTPPRWSGRLGLEWLFRLVSSPRRLGYRYLVEPWPLLFDFTKELLKYRINKFRQ